MLLSLWSCFLGWGLSRIQSSMATEPVHVAQASSPSQPQDAVGSVDPVPPQLKQGEQLYRQRCGTCHVALPPQVLPSQTWQTLLPETNHYGVRLPEFRNPELTQTWEYLSFFSRPMKEDGLRPVPYRVQRSLFFKVLHPGVEFTESVTPETCVQCHPGVSNLDFRQLSPEWQNDAGTSDPGR
ncbi:hypothetical protein [Acaryochloris sp. IP29b_bin.148]|uniref:hypothetical protein n=1 Tax=Acaryochloris sp. IP29b_bin.148 TaxID=2969218 RepID=UPI002630A1FD|nr:hypothetical protein [Acaryochloris sp. IP29b_bin.148]